MAVSPSQRFEASSVALSRMVPELPSARAKAGVEELVSMLLERMRPTGGRAVTLGRQDVADLEAAARQRGRDVEDAFKDLLKRALGGTIEVDGQKAPVLLVDEAAREQLASFAGVSSMADHTVRGGLEAHAEGERPRINTRATKTMIDIEELRMNGLRGLAVNGKKEKTSELGLIGKGIRDVASRTDRPSVALETLEALAPRIEQSVSTIGLALLKDPKFKNSLGQALTNPQSFFKGAGDALSTALGCKLVNEGVVAKGLQLLPSVGKKLGIEGIEQCAQNIGKVLLKEGAETAIKTGAQQGVKKGVMGLLSSIPLANVIPMLFTGAEMLAEFTKEKPDKRVLGKGLATFALQLGAIAFPPLGLAAAAVDLTGSVAIAVSDGQKSGLDPNDRKAQAETALAKHDARDADMAEAIRSNANVVSQALSAMERSLREVGSTERADLAKRLAERARDLHLSPDDDDAAKQLHRDIGRFSFETVLPELLDQTKRMQEQQPEEAKNWSLMREGLDQIQRSIVGVRTDPESNEPRIKVLLQGILKAGIAGSALAGESRYPARPTE